MAGRRGVGRPAVKKTAAAAAAGKGTTKSSGRHADALSSLLRQEQRRGRHNVGVEGMKSQEVEEEVTLVYRKPGAQHTRPLKDVANAAAHSTVASLPSPETSALSFMRRVTGQVNLSRYLSHCGVLDMQLSSADGEEVYALTQEQVFHCSSDRLETAVQALRNMETLTYTPTSTNSASGTPWVGHACWVKPAHQQAMVALARVCEAAVPLQLPSMVDPTVLAAMEKKERSGMTWVVPVELAEGRRTNGSSRKAFDACENGGSHPAGKSGATSTLVSSSSASSPPPVSTAATTNVELVPSPVRLCDVHRRLRCLRRLRELRIAYGGLLPRLHSAGTLTELCRCLFGHNTDACQSLGRLRQLWMSGGASSASLREMDNGVSTSMTHVLSGKGGSPAHARALYEVLSSFLGNPLVLDTLLSFVGISARHPQEEALLQHLVALLKEVTAVDASTWGPMAAMASWRCTDGVYIVQHAARVRALRRVLAEAQFYGLPRFLRSIRTVSATSASAISRVDYSDWMKPTALLHAQSRDTDRFFLTCDLLDPSSFAQPDSMQMRLVQEELITLQRTHCAFCLVVGEADQVVTLARDHLVFTGRTWQHVAKKEEEGGSSVKAEPPAADDERGGEDNDARVRPESPPSFSRDKPQHARAKDPLYCYVLRTVHAARRHDCEKKQQQQQQSAPSPSSSAPAASLPFSHVQWVEGSGTNQWFRDTHYYGLVYMVVLETDEWESGVSLVTEGLLPETAISVVGGEVTETLHPPRPPTYCVNAMLELWRS